MNVLINKQRYYDDKKKLIYNPNNFRFLNFNKKKLSFQKINIKLYRKSFQILLFVPFGTKKVNRKKFNKHGEEFGLKKKVVDDDTFLIDNKSMQCHVYYHIISDEFIEQTWVKTTIGGFNGIIKLEREHINSSNILITSLLDENQEDPLYISVIPNLAGSKYGKGGDIIPFRSDTTIDYLTTETKQIKVIISPLHALANFDVTNIVPSDVTDISTNYIGRNNFLIAIEDVNDRCYLSIVDFFYHPFIDCDFTVKIFDDKNELAELYNILIILKPYIEI